MTTPRTGSCLCGTIQYTISGDPIKSVICYCDDCQKATGGAFMANCWFPLESMQITQGQDSLQAYESQATISGKPMKRSFCQVCGSTLFLSNERMEHIGRISVTSGSLDDRSDLVPGMEFHCRSRRTWLSGLDGTVKLELQ